MSNKVKVFLIHLSGQGDVDIRIVNEDVWNWIVGPYNSNQSSYNEPIPSKVLSQMKTGHKATAYITRSTYENDRALQSPGKRFDSIKEAYYYILENNFELEEEFEGSIY